MKLKYESSKNIVSIHYELSEKEIEILRFIESNGFIEFRTGYKENEECPDDSGKFFESETVDLVKHRFIKDVDGAWNLDYELDELGKMVLRNLIKTDFI